MEIGRVPFKWVWFIRICWHQYSVSSLNRKLIHFLFPFFFHPKQIKNNTHTHTQFSHSMRHLKHFFFLYLRSFLVFFLHVCSKFGSVSFHVVKMSFDEPRRRRQKKKNEMNRIQLNFVFRSENCENWWKKNERNSLPPNVISVRRFCFDGTFNGTKMLQH